MIKFYLSFIFKSYSQDNERDNEMNTFKEKQIENTKYFIEVIENGIKTNREMISIYENRKDAHSIVESHKRMLADNIEFLASKQKKLARLLAD